MPFMAIIQIQPKHTGQIQPKRAWGAELHDHDLVAVDPYINTNINNDVKNCINDNDDSNDDKNGSNNNGNNNNSSNINIIYTQTPCVAQTWTLRMSGCRIW